MPVEKDLRPIKGMHYIRRLIDEGEHEQQDFKYKISDARKIARSMSAFANHSGGRLLIGVKDNGTVAGVRSDEDLYVIEAAAHTFCVPEVDVEMTAFRCEAGAVVYRVTIPRAAERPVFVREEDNRLKAYYRVADENIAAHPLMVAAWQLQATDNGHLLTFSPAERALLHLLELEEYLLPEALKLRAHISARAASDAITRLASLGIIQFTYRSGAFHLQLTSQPS